MSTPRGDATCSQAFLTVSLPVSLVWIYAPLLHILARRQVMVGGAPTAAMLESRVMQLRQGEVLVRFFSAYWVRTPVRAALWHRARGGTLAAPRACSGSSSGGSTSPGRGR